MSDRRDILVAAVAIAGASFTRRAFSQGTTLARMIVPFPAGGGTDLSARLLVDKMRDQYPAGLIVENRSGASGRIGVEHVKVSKPDGATMLFVTDFLLTLFPYSFKRLGYVPLQDFIPVALAGVSAYAIVAGPGLPADVRDFKGFSRWCSKNAGRASFGSTSLGSPSHFIGVMLEQAIGTKLLHVPYKGGAQALQGVMTGEVQITISPIGEILSSINGGRIRAIATTGRERNALLPGAETLVEAGIKNAVFQFWGGVVLPAKTPQAIVSRTADIINSAFRMPDLRNSYAKASKEVVLMSPAEMVALIKSDMERWQALVRASGFTAEE